MPITVPIAPRKFSYNKIADANLTEGRISIPFSLQFSNTGDAVAIQLPNGSISGYLYTLDARTVQNVSVFSSFKSIDFAALFQVQTPNDWGGVYFFSPDSGDYHEIRPAQPVDETFSQDNALVIGSVPIVSNSAFLQLIASTPQGAGNLINLCGNVNNFEKSPYIYSSHYNV